MTDASTITAPGQKDVETRFKERLVTVSATKPWVGTALSGSPVKFTDDVTDVGVNAEGTLYVNPTLLMQGSVESTSQIDATLAYAALVLLGRGFERGEGLDARAWNMALSQEITDVLSASGVERPLMPGESPMPAGGGQPAEALYVAPVRAGDYTEPIPTPVVPVDLKSRLDAAIKEALDTPSTPEPVQDYLVRTNGRVR